MATDGHNPNRFAQLNTCTIMIYTGNSFPLFDQISEHTTIPCIVCMCTTIEWSHTRDKPTGLTHLTLQSFKGSLDNIHGVGGADDLSTQVLIPTSSQMAATGLWQCRLYSEGRQDHSDSLDIHIERQRLADRTMVWCVISTYIHTHTK